MPFLTSHDVALPQEEFPRTFKVESPYGAYEIKRTRANVLFRLAHKDELEKCPTKDLVFEMVEKKQLFPDYVGRVCWMASLEDERNNNRCSHTVLHTSGSPLYTLAHAIEHLVANDLDSRGLVIAEDEDHAVFGTAVEEVRGKVKFWIRDQVPEKEQLKSLRTVVDRISKINLDPD